MPPRICMRPLVIAVALTLKWFVRRRLLSRGVIASAHAHLASSSVASTRWQFRSVPMANFSLSILLDVGPGLEMPNVGSSISTRGHTAASAAMAEEVQSRATLLRSRVLGSRAVNIGF